MNDLSVSVKLRAPRGQPLTVRWRLDAAVEQEKLALSLRAPVAAPCVKMSSPRTTTPAMLRVKKPFSATAHARAGSTAVALDLLGQLLSLSPTPTTRSIVLIVG